MTREKIGVVSIVSLSVIAFGISIFISPIEQDPSYHLFKDNRPFFSIPNFFNVASNLPFLIIGIIGIKKCLTYELRIIPALKQAYLFFFLGIALVALGSSYFHLWPNNQTLTWDRLPMTIGFMSLVTIIVAEFISVHKAKFLLWPLLLVGVFSVLYWHITEKSGQGDLRLYGLVQFLPMIIIPIVLLSFKSKFSHVNLYWWLLFFYMVAKLFEHFDSHIMFGFISGHSLKHLIAAVGLWMVLNGYQIRKKRS